jgi:chromosome segregation ATPase
MQSPSEVPQVTMANTKKELLEAYEAAKQILKAKEKDLLNADKARKALEKKAALATAEAQAAQDPVRRIHELRSALSRELTDLAERLEDEIGTYRKIQTAVTEKNDEIKTLYGVETAASDLAALLEAQQSRKDDFEVEMERRQNAFDEELQVQREQWKKEQAQQKQANQEQDQQLKKQRQREKEEFEYTFAREKEQQKNALDDELGAIEKEIAQKQDTFEKEIAQRRAALEEGEAALNRRQAELDRLEKEVESFPTRLESNVQAAIDDTTKRLTADFEKAEALLKATNEGEKNVLSSKIEALEKMVAQQNAQIEQLSQKQELAYQKVQDIANRAVDAQKREIIAVPTSSGSTPQSERPNR